jgi:hypothetical protein
MPTQPARKSWEPMTITALGHVRELVQSGEGKNSSPTKGDSGEPNKKPPGEGSG